jgi:hypothetical protein
MPVRHLSARCVAWGLAGDPASAALPSLASGRRRSRSRTFPEGPLNDRKSTFIALCRPDVRAVSALAELAGVSGAETSTTRTASRDGASVGSAVPLPRPA